MNYNDYCISKTDNTEVDHTKDLGVNMTMFILKEYNNNCGKISGSLCQYHKDNPNDKRTDCKSFSFKTKTLTRTPAAGKTNDVEVNLSLKC